MIYKNTSGAIRKFYGVEFKPGDIKFVPGYINAHNMIRVQSMPETVSDVPSNTTVDKVETPEEPVVKTGNRRKSKNILKEDITDGTDNN